MRGSKCSGGEVLGTAVCLLAMSTSVAGGSRRVQVCTGQGGLHPCLGVAQRWGAGIPEKEPEGVRLGGGSLPKNSSGDEGSWGWEWLRVQGVVRKRNKTRRESRRAREQWTHRPPTRGTKRKG